LRSICEDIALALSSSEYAFTDENLNSFYNFLLKCGENGLLIRFILQQAKDKTYKFPWGHFLEALYQAQIDMDDSLIKIIRKVLKNTDAQYEACRCYHWDSLLVDIDLWRSQKKWESGKRGPLLRKQLFEELELLRTQQLYENENLLLLKLKKIFSNDPDVDKEIQITRERKAYEVLNKYDALQASSFKNEQHENEILEGNLFWNSILQNQKENPEMTYDLALACWMLEDYSGALELLNSSPSKYEVVWLRMELLLKTRRYLELLDALPEIEMKYSSDPETFFATALLRAQSYWGLGQKHSAIEILESLIATRPHYRSATVLLNQWRGL
jgi:hypothetical protein